jgi:hypothetical protein
MANFRCLTRDSKEWHNAWAIVLNTQFTERKRGAVESYERWQYMGTHQTIDDPTWYHHFRHRFHPQTGQSERLQVQCADTSALYTPN